MDNGKYKASGGHFMWRKRYLLFWSHLVSPIDKDTWPVDKHSQTISLPKVVSNVLWYINIIDIDISFAFY